MGTKQSKTTIKIAYNNVQGKVNVRNTQTWEEIESMLTENKWEVLALTETHWRKATRKKNITNYKRYDKVRGPHAKKGGGIAVWVSEKLRSAEWKFRQKEADDDNEETEILWIKLYPDMVLGIVYMAVDNGNNDEWNERIEVSILEATEAARREGKNPLDRGLKWAHTRSEKIFLKGEV
jgi:exonuclease III